MKFTVCKTKEKFMKQHMSIFLLRKNALDTRRKLKVHQTFRRRQEHLLNVLCTSNLRHMSPRKLYTIKKHVLELVRINIIFTKVLDSLKELNFTKAYRGIRRLSLIHCHSTKQNLMFCVDLYLCVLEVCDDNNI